MVAFPIWVTKLLNYGDPEKSKYKITKYISIVCPFNIQPKYNTNKKTGISRRYNSLHTLQIHLFYLFYSTAQCTRNSGYRRACIHCLSPFFYPIYNTKNDKKNTNYKNTTVYLSIHPLY